LSELALFDMAVAAVVCLQSVGNVERSSVQGGYANYRSACYNPLAKSAQRGL